MKRAKFLKTLPMKLYLLLFAIVVFSFFSNDFGLVDIQKTAVILAAGIDKSEDGFLLTSQVAVPKGSDRSTGGTSSVEIVTEGKTVSDCVSLLFAKTGWVPKLVFCDLIVLGEEVVKDDVISELNYFLRNEYMNDSCRLAVCEGDARTLISSQSAIDDTSSMAILKLFSDAAQKAGRVIPNTLKDFAIGYFGKSESSLLPFLRAIDQKGSGTDSSESEEAAEKENAGGMKQQNQSEEKVYSAEETALFYRGKMVSLLSPEETFAYNLVEGKVKTGTFNGKDKGKDVTLNVLENKGGFSLDMKGAPKLSIRLSLTVRLCCRGTSAPMEDISGDVVSEETLKDAEENFSSLIQSIFQKGVESGCDLFALKRDLYRKSPKKYEEWKDYLPKAAKLEITIDARSMK